MQFRRPLFICLLIGALSGCVTDKRPTDPYAALKSTDPKFRVEATIELARKGDRAAVPALIGCLRDEDVSVRYFAAIALHRLTGQRFGYEAYAQETKREIGIGEWERWWARESGMGRRPAEGKLP